jgi:mitotic spindle assembly checkpoint protein MAD1
MPGGLQLSDQSARIRQLEHLVKEYKSELESISRDSRDLETKIAKGQGLVSSTLLEEANSRISTHESTIKSLETTLAELQSANTTLDAEVNDLMRRVASGEYNPKTERIVELQNNPAAKIMAVRTQILEDLKKENEVLIQRLRSSGGDGGEGSIPRESWERLVKEKEELEKAHAKRLMRLKEVSYIPVYWKRSPQSGHPWRYGLVRRYMLKNRLSPFHLHLIGPHIA